jgi:hypothetical protein
MELTMKIMEIRPTFSSQSIQATQDTMLSQTEDGKTGACTREMTYFGMVGSMVPQVIQAQKDTLLWKSSNLTKTALIL